MKCSFIYLIIFIPFISCGRSKCEIKDGQIQNNSCKILAQFKIADKSNPLDFNHHCASRVDNTLHAYALFERESQANYKALALGDVIVGWFFLDRGTDQEKYVVRRTERGVIFGQGISFHLNKLMIQSLNGWGNDFFAIALQLVNLKTGKIITGKFSKTFYMSDNFSPVRKHVPYQMSNGHFDWFSSLEPENEKLRPKNERGIYKNIKSNEIFIPVQHLGQSAREPHSINFVLKNLNSGSSILLNGPVLDNLEEKLKIELNKPRSLGLFQMFNPKQEGSIWSWARDSKKYGKCIFLRKQAKKIFDIRLNQQNTN